MLAATVMTALARRLLIYSACLSLAFWHHPARQTQQVDRFGGSGWRAVQTACCNDFQNSSVSRRARPPEDLWTNPQIPLPREAYEAVFKDLADLKWQSLCSLEKRSLPVDGIRRLVLLLFFTLTKPLKRAAASGLKSSSCKSTQCPAPAFRVAYRQIQRPDAEDCPNLFPY